MCCVNALVTVVYCHCLSCCFVVVHFCSWFVSPHSLALISIRPYRLTITAALSTCIVLHFNRSVWHVLDINNNRRFGIPAIIDVIAWKSTNTATLCTSTVLYFNGLVMCDINSMTRSSISAIIGALPCQSTLQYACLLANLLIVWYRLITCFCYL